MEELVMGGRSDVGGQSDLGPDERCGEVEARDVGQYAGDEGASLEGGPVRSEGALLLRAPLDIGPFAFADLAGRDRFELSKGPEAADGGFAHGSIGPVHSATERWSGLTDRNRGVARRPRPWPRH